MGAEQIRAGWFVRIVSALVALFVLGPLVVVAGISLNGTAQLDFPPKAVDLRWYDEVFGSPLWRDAILYSLELGLIVTVVATVLGTALAVGLSRGSARLRSVGFAIVLLPLVVPGIVVAVALYLTFSEWRVLGTTPAFAAAHVALAVPFVVVNVLSSLQLVGRDYERAAVSLGAHPLRAFAGTTLRLALPGVLAGAVFAFITSWDEVVVAIFVSGPETQTLPMAMWEQIRSAVDPAIAAVATCLMIITVLGIGIGAAGRALTRRRVENARSK